jgi:hypothetical protein
VVGVSDIVEWLRKSQQLSVGMDGKLDEAADEIERLRADKAAISQTASDYLHEIEQLRAALKECADDLESELNGHYQGTLDYPSQQRRFERDMAPITAARKLLAGE